VGGRVAGFRETRFGPGVSSPLLAGPTGGAGGTFPERVSSTGRRASRLRPARTGAPAAGVLSLDPLVCSAATDRFSGTAEPCSPDVAASETDVVSGCVSAARGSRTSAETSAGTADPGTAGSANTGSGTALSATAVSATANSRAGAPSAGT
jgi:hypothetical protein